VISEDQARTLQMDSAAQRSIGTGEAQEAARGCGDEVSILAPEVVSQVGNFSVRSQIPATEDLIRTESSCILPGFAVRLNVQEVVCKVDDLWRDRSSGHSAVAVLIFDLKKEIVSYGSVEGIVPRCILWVFWRRVTLPGSHTLLCSLPWLILTAVFGDCPNGDYRQSNWCQHNFPQHSAISSIPNGFNLAVLPWVVKASCATLRKTKFALGYFPAEHHGTADKQGGAADRTQRGCIASGMPISAVTGGQAGPRGGQPRHCLSFIDEAE